MNKLIQYARAYTGRSVADQRSAGAAYRPALVVVEGQDGRTFDDAIKVLKPGNGLLIDSVLMLNRRRDTACGMLEKVAAKGCGVVIMSDVSQHPPEAVPSLIAGVRARGVTVRGDEPQKPRVPHNKADDETRARAEKMWRQKRFAGMSNGEIAEEVGVSIVTLMQWFGPRGRRPGRRKKPPVKG